MICSRRLYKGNPYEICLPLTDSGVTMARFYTAGDVIIEKVPDISGDSMCFSFTEEEIASLPDGVLRYEIVTDYETSDTNTPFVVVTPGDYSGQTLDDLLEEAYDSGLTACSGGSYEEGYQSGYTDGYNYGFESGHDSGVTDGENIQKGKLEPLDVLHNGYYEREDGYKFVFVDVPEERIQDSKLVIGSGMTWDGYHYSLYIPELKPDEGYDAMRYVELFVYTEATEAIEYGENQQKAKLTSTAFTQNGTYTRTDGWSAVTVNISGYTQQDLDNAYASGWSAGYNSGYTDGLNDCSGETSGYTDMYLTFDIISGGTISFGERYGNGDIHTIEYRKNSGNWTEVTFTNPFTTITVNSGDVIELRGDIESYGSVMDTFYNSTAYFNAYGNIMSLVDSTGFATATTLSTDYTFGPLFENTNLVSAEHLVLPATSLAYMCYYSMFRGCTSLTSTPSILPATTLADYCYQHMFNGCSSLTTAPSLPATTLATQCYSNMFQSCSSLTTAPELPATILADYCYFDMFNGCSNLNYIKCLATDISASNCTEEWVTGVSSTGTFVKNPNMSVWPTGNNGIPSDWTVQDNNS